MRALNPLKRLQQSWHVLQTRVLLLDRIDNGVLVLSQRRVYTLPNRAGLGYLLLLLILFLASVNYGVNLGLAFTFVLASCALLNLLLSFRNLAWLHLKADSATDVFQGEDAQFHLTLINRHRYTRFAIWLGFADQRLPLQPVDLPPFSNTRIVLHCPTTIRGAFLIPRIHLRTAFPLGILRAWSYWRPDLRAIVYPMPESHSAPFPLLIGEGGDIPVPRAGEEDFAGIRAYRSGDPLKHLAWRQMAKFGDDSRGTLLSKQFESNCGAALRFDLNDLPTNLDLEHKLSRLTRWVLDAENLGLPYALQLPGQQFPPACGEPHRTQCLRALALYTP